MQTFAPYYMLQLLYFVIVIFKNIVSFLLHQGGNYLNILMSFDLYLL